MKSNSKEVLTNDKWLTSIPSDLIGIMSSLCDYSEYDYILIYNTDTSEYNALPTNSGTYHLINILYCTHDNQMEIIEYDMEYVK